jgi:hypothetical protein
MDISKMSGEELCEIQASQFNALMQAQGNLQAIAAELNRRKEAKPKADA